ncbi:MAG: esterase, partial [Jiangellaceae bacterium]
MATTDLDGSPFPVSAVEGDQIVFRLADANHELSGVRLWQQLGLEDDRLDFATVDGGWELRIPRPPVLRMEYLFATHTDDGAVTTGVDPTNPLRVNGPFGEHSVIELPGYAAPKWFTAEAVESRLEPLTVTATPVGEVAVQVWSPADSTPTDELPLLLSHDGPEFASYAGLTQFVGALIAAGSLPRLRLALLTPGDRNVWYSANDDYA